MKKYTWSLLTAALFAAAGTAHADDFSLTGGIDYMYTDASGSAQGQTHHHYQDNSLWTGFIDFKHPLLLVPNAMFQTSQLDTSASGFHNNLSAYDWTLYYSPINEGSLHVDVGANLRNYDGKIRHGQSYSDDSVMFYGAAEAPIPNTDFSAFGDVRFSRWDGDHSHDWKVGVAYNVFPEDVLKFKVRAGYRNIRVDLTDNGVNLNQHLDNWFLGAELQY